MSEGSSYPRFASLALSLLRRSSFRRLSRLFCSTCKNCKKARIEIALDRCAGKVISACMTCSLFSLLIRSILKAQSLMLGYPDEATKFIINDPFTRRGLLSAIKGIAYFGVRKPQVTGAPFLIVWNYTNACNLNCKHCYQDAGPRPSADELSTDQAMDVVDQLADAGVVAISFSGGEPLVRKDFFEVSKYAYERGLYVSVATNGTLITDEVAVKMKEHGVQYAEISLDGASSETHDSFRAMKGSFDRAIRGIKACVKAGLYTCIATTITKRNLNEVSKIIEIAKRLQVKRFIYFNFVPTGRGRDIAEVDLSPEEREDLLKMLYRELVDKVSRKGGIECFATAPQLARVSLQMSRGQNVIPLGHYGRIGSSEMALAEFIGGCGAGRLYCGINPNGKVIPCVFMPIEVGDLKRDSFEEVWLRSKVLNELRDRSLLKGRCGRCPYRFVCGGCRARAYGYYRDYLAPDPGCIRIYEDPDEKFGLDISA